MSNKKAQTDVLVVECDKGGVGKTTIASTLGAGLAIRGLEVVLIDTDAQGSLSRLCGFKEDNGLYRAIVENARLPDVLHAVPPERWRGDTVTDGQLFILPGEKLTARIPSFRPDDGYMMLDLLNAIDAHLRPDVIVVDTSPSVAPLTAALRLATDWLLYVAECEPLAMEGLTGALQQMFRQAAKREQYFGKPTEIMGIVPNKLKPKTTLHRELIRQIGEAYGQLVWSPIFDRIAWANATYFRVPVFVSEPDGQAAKDAWKLIDRALEVLNAA